MPAEPEKKPSFQELSEAPQPGLMAEFFDFLRHNKKWWLLPILVMISVFGLLMVLASSPAAPFIYTLF